MTSRTEAATEEARRQLLAEMANAGKPWYEIRAQGERGATDDADATDVLIYESIGGWFGLSARDLVEELKAIATPTIRLRINSPGGAVFAAVAIASALQHHPARIVAYVDGVAASAASVIAVTADELVMMPGSQLMIHDASMITWGNPDELRADADFLDAQSDNIAGFYARKGGGDPAQWRDLMRAETWMTAEEALTLGLADQVEAARSGPKDALLDRLHDLAGRGYRYAGRSAAPPPGAPRPARVVQVRERPTPAPAGLDLAGAASARAAAAARGDLPAVPLFADRHQRYQSTQHLRREPSSALDLPARIRCELRERDGKPVYMVEGYFTVYERGYEMWDEFGPYIEIVARGAGADSLAAKPDVAYLVNHTGLSMARTINGSLELEEDDTGGRNRAWLNPERGDVKDLVHGIDDRTITEQSFAFLITSGRWSPDFTQYRIEAYDVDRGDTGPVNYGANPYTSIATRSLDVLRHLDQLPAGIAREYMTRLARRTDLTSPAAPPPAAGEDRSATVDVDMLEVEAFIARAEALRV